MMKRIGFILTLVLTVSPIYELRADQGVLADAQVITVGEEDYLLRLRSTEPLAFDVIEQDNSSEAHLKLYGTRLGQNLNPLENVPFGSVEWVQENENQVRVSLGLSNPELSVQVQQGGDAGVVEVRVKKVPVDNTPPVISDVQTAALTLTGVKISWTTDKPSTSQVVYGETQPESQETNLSGEYTRSHEIELSGLNPSTLYYFQVLSVDAAGNSARSESYLFTTRTPAFKEISGQVVIEAENFDKRISRNAKYWAQQKTLGGYSGEGYLIALPNTGALINAGYTATSPELVYNIEFETPGTYYIWLRGRGSNTINDDSIHAGFNGVAIPTADRIGDFKNYWGWLQSTMDGPVATLTVPSPGLHTFHLWMREDGVQIDKILLRTSNSTALPAGTGPSESPRNS